MATGPTYSPLAEDAGKRITVAIQYKGVVAEGEVGAVGVSQELENEVQELLKKKRALTLPVSVMSELTPEEMASRCV